MNLPMSPLLLSLSVALCAGCNKEHSVLAGGKPIGHWIEATRDSSEKVRKQAIEKLGNVGDSDPSVFPALIAALKDSASGVRREAIVAIVKHGPGAESAVDSLKPVASGDPDPQVREYAARALQKLTRP
jgi:HEAT repeat protein